MASGPGDHVLGRSRGGLTTKLHLTVEQGQKPLSLLVTAGERHDSLHKLAVRYQATVLVAAINEWL
jgi:hypothetical protein